MIKFCVICGKELTGRQKKVCSDECRRMWRNKCNREWSRNNPERVKERGRIYRLNNQEKIKESRYNNRESLKEKRGKKKERVYEKLARIWNLEKFTCHHCGVKGIKFLSIGHPLGNGKEHRKEVGSGSQTMLNWILNATDELIKKWVVKPECAGCNIYHEHHGEYSSNEILLEAYSSATKFLESIKKREDKDEEGKTTENIR